jgi:hypothetical protein
MAKQPEVEKVAKSLYQKAPEMAREYLTKYSIEQGENTVKRWKKLGIDLLVKYLDGNVKDEVGKVTHPGYPKSWYKRIVEDKGEEHFKVKTSENDH